MAAFAQSAVNTLYSIANLNDLFRVHLLIVQLKNLKTMNEIRKMTALRQSMEVMEFVYDFYSKEAQCYFSDYNRILECKICINENLEEEFYKIWKYAKKMTGEWGKVETSHREDLKNRYITINYKIKEIDCY